ncbi:MAG: THUMP domain-containing protein [Saprospiraceae bacterium]
MLTELSDTKSTYQCLGKTLEGLEDILEKELHGIGIEKTDKLTRAVAFEATLNQIYKANILVRTCLKILVVLEEFLVRNEQDLYIKIKGMAWEELFKIDQTFAVDSVVNSDYFTHANFVALKVKDGIVDRFREKYGERPNIDKYNPDFQIQVHIRQKTVTISIDTSGDSLHKRGYRTVQTDAPLNEVLAAGIVLMSDWDTQTQLYDPMCGSATLLIEGALIAMNLPPQPKERKYLFMNWKGFDHATYQTLLDSLYNSVNKNLMPNISGSDISAKNIDIARINIKNAGLNDIITLHQEDFFYSDPKEHICIITNPPYDIRIKHADIDAFYQQIGDKLKLSYTNSVAWILCGNLEASKFIGLRPSRKISLLNGSIPSKLNKYELYKGSKKAKYQNSESETH